MVAHTCIPTDTASHTMQQPTTPHTRGVDAPTHQPIQTIATGQTTNPPFNQPATQPRSQPTHPPIDTTSHTMRGGGRQWLHTQGVHTHTHTQIYTPYHTMEQHRIPRSTWLGLAQGPSHRSTTWLGLTQGPSHQPQRGGEMGREEGREGGTHLPFSSKHHKTYQNRIQKQKAKTGVPSLTLTAIQ